MSGCDDDQLHRLLEATIRELAGPILQAWGAPKVLAGPMMYSGTATLDLFLAESVPVEEAATGLVLGRFLLHIDNGNFVLRVVGFHPGLSHPNPTNYRYCMADPNSLEQLCAAAVAAARQWHTQYDNWRNGFSYTVAGSTRDQGGGSPPAAGATV